MSAEPVTVNRPPYPLHAMTTHELSGYRRNLERAIPGLPEADSAVLRRKLDDVLAEEDDRRRIQANLP